jgi:secreted PhoX family phosphatase
VFFANEESDDDLAVPPGATYGPDPAIAPLREAGYVVALDAASGTYAPIPGMGRHNHENTVIVPGRWDEVVALSGDDTFNAPSSQMYLYSAATPEALLADEGTLFAFRVTATQEGPVDAADPFNGANDYGDIAVGDDWQGEFIPVPDDVADGTTALAPQAGLEQWSNDNNVFQFIRVEDIAYDKNTPYVVYFADTGERRAVENPATGRLMRAPSGTMGPYPNGRIFRMVLDPHDPNRVVSFSILLDADAGGYDNPDVMHAPDNIDTSGRSLMVQEDSSQPPNSRIWRYDLHRKTWSVVASVLDADWESSGIVDASAAFGKGTWLVDVQGHGDFVDVDTTSVPGVTIKRESGQLLLLRLPGS